MNYIRAQRILFPIGYFIIALAASIWANDFMSRQVIDSHLVGGDIEIVVMKR